MRWPIRRSMGRWHPRRRRRRHGRLVGLLVGVDADDARGESTRRRWGHLALVVVLTVPFIAHRRYPLAALGVTVAAFLALAGLHSAFYGLQLFAILCAIALHADRRRSWGRWR